MTVVFTDERAGMKGMGRATSGGSFTRTAVLLLGLFVGGCGYHLGGNLPPHVKTVAVPVFKKGNAAGLRVAERASTAAVRRSIARVIPSFFFIDVSFREHA